MFLNDDDNKLIFMLRWNNIKGMGYGTFNIEKDVILNIGVFFFDNFLFLLYDGWDGKSLIKLGNGIFIFFVINNYIGNIEVKFGVLIFVVFDVFGWIEYLYLFCGVELDMNGYFQIISKLLMVVGFVLNIYGGSLILNNGGEFVGIIVGDGFLNINGGMFDIMGNNCNFFGVFIVNKGVYLVVFMVDNLGIVFVDNYGTLILNSILVWQFINNISGYGNVCKMGVGVLNISDNVKWIGMIDIIQGIVILGNVDLLVMFGSNQVIVEEQGKFFGFGGVVGNLSNSGIVDFIIYMLGNILIVGGNYIGRNGFIFFQIEIGGDNLKIDCLVIKGNVSGCICVVVTQVGGIGVETLNGIEVIYVSGNVDNVEFIQMERIIVGVYDYILKCGQGINSINWYLISRKDIFVL